MVERNIEPAIEVGVDGIIFVAYRSRGKTLFEGDGLCRRAVFVGATYVDDVLAHHTAEPRKDICGEHGEEISQVRLVVDVGQC